jgi:hypothetical protein
VGRTVTAQDKAAPPLSCNRDHQETRDLDRSINHLYNPIIYLDPSKVPACSICIFFACPFHTCFHGPFANFFARKHDVRAVVRHHFRAHKTLVTTHDRNQFSRHNFASAVRMIPKHCLFTERAVSDRPIHKRTSPVIGPDSKWLLTQRDRVTVRFMRSMRSMRGDRGPNSLRHRQFN